MTQAQVAATLVDDARLILPVGTCERYHATLPLGCATIIAERLADDLSAEFGVLRGPTLEYGVNPPPPPVAPGYVSLHKKTLHRTLNDLLATWEQHGIAEFILLTAHGYDPHEEALSTVATTLARVRVVDLFAVNIPDLAGYRRSSDDRSEVYLALLRYLAPELVGHDGDNGATAEWGRSLYERIRSRVSERIFLVPSLAE